MCPVDFRLQRRRAESARESGAADANGVRLRRCKTDCNRIIEGRGTDPLELRHVATDIARPLKI